MRIKTNVEQKGFFPKGYIVKTGSKLLSELPKESIPLVLNGNYSYAKNGRSNWYVTYDNGKKKTITDHYCSGSNQEPAYSTMICNIDIMSVFDWDFKVMKTITDVSSRPVIMWLEKVGS